MSLLGYGRSVIYTNHDEITDENVVEVLKESYKEHLNNRADIVRLWEYYHIFVKELKYSHKIMHGFSTAILILWKHYATRHSRGKLPRTPLGVILE